MAPRGWRILSGSAERLHRCAECCCRLLQTSGRDSCWHTVPGTHEPVESSRTVEGVLFMYCLVCIATLLDGKACFKACNKNGLASPSMSTLLSNYAICLA
jgi:hypothetical protein